MEDENFEFDGSVAGHAVAAKHVDAHAGGVPAIATLLDLGDFHAVDGAACPATLQNW